MPLQAVSLLVVDADVDEDEEASFVDVPLSFWALSLESEVELVVGPLADELDERESVMYQPLPLKTMPTGWMILRSVPPHCSQVVSGGSEKLWRFSMTSLQAVQV
jgi:hypothetical protein